MKSLGIHRPALLSPFRLAGLSLGLAALLGAGCNRQPPAAQARPPQAVTAATVAAQDVPHYLNALGQTTAFEFVNVVSQVPGQITELPFTQGTIVKKGAVLAQIDPQPYKAAVQQASGQVIANQANLKLAQLQVDRSKPLLSGNLISPHQYDTYVAQVEQLKGQLEVDQGRLELAKINLAYCTITAPVDGMVGNYKMNIGNVVKANDSAITTIAGMDPIYADFVVAVSDFPLLRQFYDANGGKLTAKVSSLTDPTKFRDGELTVLGNSIATATGTIALRATVPNKDRLFWPNQPVKVTIMLDTAKDAVLIPAEAVGMSQQGIFVFVIKPGTPATVEMRPIQPGQNQAGGLIVINDGLKAGEQVVVKGQIFLQPGAAVQVLELDGKSLAPPPGAAGAAAPPAAAPGGNSTAANTKG